jgi:hypothetical protein
LTFDDSLIDSDMRAGLRDAARQADIDAAYAFGFGGTSWHVVRPSGSGTGVRTLVAADDVTLLAFEQQPAPVAPAASGVPILAPVWRYILISGTVQPGDVVTSAADSRYAFGVATTDPWYEYIRGDLERRR